MKVAFVAGDSSITNARKMELTDLPWKIFYKTFGLNWFFT